MILIYKNELLHEIIT